MKVQVNLKIASKFDASAAMFSFTVSLMDTVMSVKERFAAAHMIAFPHELLLDGKILLDELKLLDCGVKENSSLDFVVQASEGSLVKQFAELLQTRDLSCDEIGMLYCYKHGVSANQSLKTVGYSGKLIDFLKTQKGFSVDNGLVTLVREDTKMKPFSAVDELKIILEESDTGSMEISLLSSKFSQKFKVSIDSVAGMRASKLFATEKDLFVVSGRGTVTLKKSTADNDPEQKLVEAIVSSHRRAQSGERAEKIATAGATPSSHINAAGGPPSPSTLMNVEVEQTVNDIVDTVSQAMFLSVDHVVSGWAFRKDTANSSLADAEVVLFLQGLPPSMQSKWLPALLKSVAGVLTESLCPAAGRRQYPALFKSNAGRWLEGIRVLDDSLQVRVKDVVDVNLRFSPVLEN